MCFDELDEAMVLLAAGRTKLSPTQRRLTERFNLVAVQFAHDMLLAEGHHEEVERRLVASGRLSFLYLNPSPETVQIPSGEAPIDSGREFQLIEDVGCNLSGIQKTAQDAISEGIAKILDALVTDESLNDAEKGICKALRRSVDELQSDIESIFCARLGIIDSVKRQHAARIGSAAIGGQSNSTFTVDCYIAESAVPERRLRMVDRADVLRPHLADIKKLRSRGYTWSQVSGFLRRNGIEIYHSVLPRYVALLEGGCNR